jgi:hypothetical protein
LTLLEHIGHRPCCARTSSLEDESSENKKFRRQFSCPFHYSASNRCTLYATAPCTTLRHASRLPAQKRQGVCLAQASAPDPAQSRSRLFMLVSYRVHSCILVSTDREQPFAQIGAREKTMTAAEVETMAVANFHLRKWHYNISEGYFRRRQIRRENHRRVRTLQETVPICCRNRNTHALPISKKSKQITHSTSHNTY